jgi:hypothetical protein
MVELFCIANAGRKYRHVIKRMRVAKLSQLFNELGLPWNHFLIVPRRPIASFVARRITKWLMVSKGDKVFINIVSSQSDSPYTDDHHEVTLWSMSFIFKISIAEISTDTFRLFHLIRFWYLFNFYNCRRNFMRFSKEKVVGLFPITFFNSSTWCCNYI